MEISNLHKKFQIAKKLFRQNITNIGDGTNLTNIILVTFYKEDDDFIPNPSPNTLLGGNTNMDIIDNSTQYFRAIYWTTEYIYEETQTFNANNAIQHNLFVNLYLNSHDSTAFQEDLEAKRIRKIEVSFASKVNHDINDQKYKIPMSETYLRINDFTFFKEGTHYLLSFSVFSFSGQVTVMDKSNLVNIGSIPYEINPQLPDPQ